MKAIILAAGQGKRLENFTKGRPKCLLSLAKETILSREIRILKNSGINAKDIFVVGGYRADLLKSIAPNLIVNELYDKYDNSYSLGLALQRIEPDDIILMDADLCFEESLISELIDNTHDNAVLSIRSTDTTESTGIVTDKEYRVTAIGKGYENTGFVYISLMKFSKETVPDFTSLLLEEESKKTWYTFALTKLCKITLSIILLPKKNGMK